jgi:uncharacterized protein (DUF1501 family)
MSRIHFEKRRNFLKGAGGIVASGAMAGFIPQLSMMGTALASVQPTGYKALVCIYLDGGNDSFNLLIPATAARHTEYVAARGGLYQGNATSLGIPVSGGGGVNLPNARALNGTVGGNSFAVNPFAGELADLYNARRLAFIANVGPLVDPYRKTGNPAGTRRPPQLYSHSDQTNLWQIGGGTNSNDARGWGGRVAGNVVAATPSSGLSPCISISGQNRFLSGAFELGGNPINPYRMSDSTTSPAVSLSNYSNTDTASAGSARRETFNSLLNATYPQLFSSEYKDIVARSMSLADALNAQITTGIPAAFQNAINAMPNTSLGRQLRQVAQMIRVSRAGGPLTIQANRQIFYVRLGGFDTHDGQISSLTAANGHHGLLQQLAQATNGFYNCLAALNGVAGYAGVLNEVLSFTMSDFSRTINSNGNGTDHAWGSVQMVMGNPTTSGGSLLGQDIYGPYPRQILNNTQNDGSPLPLQERGESYNRGEFIPRVSVDQMAATFARWMGVSNTEIPAIFPNLDSMLAHPQASLLGYQTRTMPFLNI